MTTEYRGHGGHQAASHAEGTHQKAQSDIDIENALTLGYKRGFERGYREGRIDGRSEVRESVERACADVFGSSRTGGGNYQKPGEGGRG